MISQENAHQLTQFRQQVYQNFNKRADVMMDLIDALSSNTSARSIVELSLNPVFRRDYTSLLKAIEECQIEVSEVVRSTKVDFSAPKQRSFWLLGVDVTPQACRFAPTLEDLGFVYQPNTLKGNKPVTIGHQYPSVVLLPEKETEQADARFGWRVYGTNHSKGHLPLAKAVLAYRNEYLVERGFTRLQGRTFSLTPLYLQDDTRVIGLIRLLPSGLRVLTLLEFVVQRRLAENLEKLGSLYAGNPKRTTATPRAETLLEAYKSIYLTTVTIGEQIHLHVTPLSTLQQKILHPLGFSPDIYARLALDSLKPP